MANKKLLTKVPITKPSEPEPEPTVKVEAPKPMTNAKK